MSSVTVSDDGCRSLRVPRPVNQRGSNTESHSFLQPIYYYVTAPSFVTGYCAFPYCPGRGARVGERQVQFVLFNCRVLVHENQQRRVRRCAITVELTLKRRKEFKQTVPTEAHGCKKKMKERALLLASRGRTIIY